MYFLMFTMGVENMDSYPRRRNRNMEAKGNQMP